MGSSSSVVIGSYSDALSANLVRLRLESEGITAWLQDEHATYMYPGGSAVFGGVKVAVALEDVEHAQCLIYGEPSDDNGEEPVTGVCPKCGVKAVGPNRVGYVTMLFLTILTCGLYLVLFHRDFKCANCGHRC